MGFASGSRHALRRYLLPVTACLAFLTPPHVAAEPAAGPPAESKPQASVLFVYANHGDQEFQRYFAAMRDKGIHCRLVHPSAVNADLCRQFNVLVHLSWGTVVKGMPDSGPRVSEETDARLRAIVREHTEQGGGQLFCSATDELGPLAGGLTALSEVVLDDTAQGALRRYVRDEFAWTDNVTASPVTNGVRKLWYPTGTGIDYLYLATLSPGPDWQVVVRGREAASSHRYKRQTSPRVDRTQAGRYAAAPPLVAIRETGRGRQAALFLHPTYSFAGYRHLVFEGVPMEKGPDGSGSDLAQLYENLLLWLAAPSRDSGVLGGFVRPVPAPAKPLEVKPLTWDDEPNAVVKYTPYETHTGVLGVHSAFSNGRGSVADYVAAAKAVGCDVLLFTESFEHLTREKWDALATECARHTGPDFLCLPGFEYRSAIGPNGNRYFLVGDATTWPDPQWLTADGRRVRDPVNLWFKAGVPLHGFFGWRDSYWQPSDYLGINSTAVLLYDKGKLVEDNTDVFLQLQRNEDDLVPAVLDLVYEPAELADSAKHARMKFTGTLAEIRTFLRSPMYGQGNDRAYISSGPELLDWSKENGVRNTDGLEYVPGHDRWRLHLALRATVPLTEVRLYDGPRLIRRFLPTGDSFEQTLDLPHDRQRHLTAAATDRNGGRLLSWMRWTRDLRQARKMCSDRCNSIPISQLRDAAGRSRIEGPTGIYHVKGTVEAVCVAGGVPQIPLVDGGFIAVAYNPHPALVCTEGQEGQVRELNFRMLHRLTSRDLFFQESQVERKWLHGDQTVGSRPEFTAVPTDLFTADIRHLDFNRETVDAPYALLLLDGSITLKRDLSFPQAAADAWDLPGVRVLTAYIGDLGYAAAFRAGTGANVFWSEPPTPKEGVRRWSGSLDSGNYLSVMPVSCGSGTVYSLTDGLVGHLQMTATECKMRFGFRPDGRALAKGTVLPYRLLILRGRANERTNDVQERFRRDFGLDGQAPAYRVEARSGTVHDTRFFLNLGAADGGFEGTVSRAPLLLRLPLRIDGLNENWTAVVGDRSTGRLIPLGIAEELGTGYGLVDTREREWTLFVGHPVICDRPELPITVVPIAENERTTRIKVEVHNPAADPVSVRLRTAPAFSAWGTLDERLDLPPGSSACRIVSLTRP